MKIPNRQIGWSQEAILLHGISKQLAFVYGLTSGFPRNIHPMEVNPGNFTAWNNGPAGEDTNTVFGVVFLSNTTGYDNSIFGEHAYLLSTTNYQNTIFGFESNRIIPNAIQNTLIGSYTLNDSTTSNYNTAFGSSVGGDGANSTGTNNTLFGDHCAGYLTTGSYNVAVGTNSILGKVSGVGDANVAGSYNVGIGYQALRVLSTGNNNIHIDYELGAGVSSGSRNIIFDQVSTARNPNTFNNNVVIAGLNNSLLGVDGQIIIGTGAANVRRMEFGTIGAMIITVAPTNGGGVATEKLILLDTVSDSNGMSSVKTIDYIDTNATTTALTLANLNTTYPGASIGFRVNCIAIAGAPRIYTKVSTTAWCSEVITNVA